MRDLAAGRLPSVQPFHAMAYPFSAELALRISTKYAGERPMWRAPLGLGRGGGPIPYLPHLCLFLCVNGCNESLSFALRTTFSDEPLLCCSPHPHRLLPVSGDAAGAAAAGAPAGGAAEAGRAAARGLRVLRLWQPPALAPHGLRVWPAQPQVRP